MTIDVKELLTVAEIAKRSPLSESALRGRIERGQLKAVRIAAAVFVREPDVIASLGPALYSPPPPASSRLT